MSSSTEVVNLLHHPQLDTHSNRALNRAESLRANKYPLAPDVVTPRILTLALFEYSPLKRLAAKMDLDIFPLELWAFVNRFSFEDGLGFNGTSAPEYWDLHTDHAIHEAQKESSERGLELVTPNYLIRATIESDPVQEILTGGRVNRFKEFADKAIALTEEPSDSSARRIV